MMRGGVDFWTWGNVTLRLLAFLTSEINVKCQSDVDSVFLLIACYRIRRTKIYERG